MKRLVSLLTVLAMMACLVPALAEEEVVYGTMAIPYEAFYAAEGVGIAVDAVSSATNSKWKNESLVAGTYYEAHADDEGGDILGVVYPVAISPADLDALGEENYGFAPLDEIPAAYKAASLEGGELAFSAVVGEASEFEAEATLTTESRYGDYQIDVKSINNQDGTSDIGTIYGVLLVAEDGGVYALRHLENIWRDNLAFSAGFKTKEGHGNPLNPENFAELMGKTITAITYITDTGYHTLPVSLYVPVKFDGGAQAADAPVSDGKTAITLTGLPEDYAAAYAVKGLTTTVAEGELSFEDALPGSYTLTVSDEKGVYADLLASFVLTTDELPVAFDEAAGVLVPAEGAEEALFNAFLANIASVTVNEENTYAAAGKGAVIIVNADGEIDPEAASVSGRGADAVSTPIFAENGEYTLTVTSTGFTQALTFVVVINK